MNQELKEKIALAVVGLLALGSLYYMYYLAVNGC
tara:strand:+ start:597 stop:698 length:102 start_codon:yes stop_codon:yes gene_type:complete